MSITVMGLDTGFSHVGWTIANMAKAPTAGEGLTIVAMGHLGTQKSDKKKGVRAADDNFERARTIARRLHSVCEAHKPQIVCSEAISHVRSNSVMLKIGMCFGVVTMLVSSRDIPFLQATPMDIKKAVADNKQASKEEIQHTLDMMFDGVPHELVGSLAKSKREHPYDSLGAIVACWESDPMRAMRAMVK